MHLLTDCVMNLMVRSTCLSTSSTAYPAFGLWAGCSGYLIGHFERQRAVTISVVLRGAAKVATVNQLATFEIWIRYAADAKLDSFLFPERQEEFVRCFKSSTGVSSADYKKENLHCYNPAGRKLDKAIRIQPN
jgi:hypothetical protein